MHHLHQDNYHATRVAIPAITRCAPRSRARRARTGCLTCKKRRVKCDERKPFCGQCQRMRIPCEGMMYSSGDSNSPGSKSSDSLPCTPSFYEHEIPETSSVDGINLGALSSAELPLVFTTVGQLGDVAPTIDLECASPLLSLDFPASLLEFACSDDFSDDFSETALRSSDDAVEGLGTSWSLLDHSVNGILGNQHDFFLNRFFCDALCAGILPTMVHGPANPLTAAFSPLIKMSPSVSLCSQALSALHMAAFHPASYSLVEALRLKGRAIQSLTKDLGDARNQRLDEVLASTLLLNMCEEISQRWDNLSNTRHTHLKGARQLIKLRFFTSSGNTTDTVDTWSTRAMVKIFIWKDTLTSMMLPSSDYAASWTLDALRLTDLLNKEGDTNPFLFGTARDVFWLMNEVGSLARRVSSKNIHQSSLAFRLSILNQATKLEKRIQNYVPTESPSKIYFGNYRPSDTDLQDCLTTVECYRLSSLLYLYQIVPQMLPVTRMEELAVDIVELALSIPTTSPTIAFHTWVLILAGSQLKPASTDESSVVNSIPGATVAYRDLVIERLRIIEQKHPYISSVWNSEKLLRENWRRQDIEDERTIPLRDAIRHWCYSAPEQGRIGFIP